jgi:galactokinase
MFACKRFAMIDTNELKAKFALRFGGEPQIYRAPGRVNLIGDHTDYNDGFVLPAAIGFSCYLAISRRNDGELTIFSENTRQTITAPADADSMKPAGTWSDYALGVFSELRSAGYSLGGANLYISSEVPIGAGLSSSAALEVSTAYALLGIFGNKINPLAVAKLCQKAENNFVGAKCGIMDQFASSHGCARHALLLDCRSLQHRPIPIPDSLRVVICNTMVKHQLGFEGSDYNARRAQCEEGVQRLAEAMPNIRALRDVTLLELEKHRGLLSDVIYKRCRHVVTENERVRQMTSALECHDLKRMRDLMAESHRSLREDYEVSCPELDLMVNLATQQKGVYGARMTGAGFGGCTVNLVEADFVKQFQSRVAAEYSAQTGRTPEIYICEAVEGAGREPD